MYAEFPRRALFDKIGMTSSALIETDASGAFIGSSFGYATARDWARLGMLYINDGVWEGQRILPEGWVAYTRTPAPADPLKRYGAHVWLKVADEYSGDAVLPDDAFHAIGHAAMSPRVRLPACGVPLDVPGAPTARRPIRHGAQSSCTTCEISFFIGDGWFGGKESLFTASLDIPLDFEGVGEAGSMLGTRALQLFDETTCVVRAVLRWTEFYKHESCGKCTPCREGTWWLTQTMARLEKGQGDEGDLDLLLDQCDNILGRSFCALGDGATSPISSSIQHFRDEYLAHLTHGGCPFDPAASTAFAPVGAPARAPPTRRPRRSTPAWSP